MNEEPRDIYNRNLIPETMLDTLIEWAATARPVGGCAEAILCNDLMQAFQRADEFTTRAMPAIMSFVYNQLPARCCGSREHYETWPALCKEFTACAPGFPEMIRRKAVL